MGGGLAYQETIEEMDRELTRVVEDFDRAVNVEALRQTKETGELSFSQSLDSSFSIVVRRAEGFAWSAQICQGRLSPGSRLYGRHPQIAPRTNQGLGDQWIGADRRGKYILGLRHAWHRQDVVSAFDLRESPRSKAACGSIFLSKGRPGIERA